MLPAATTVPHCNAVAPHVHSAHLPAVRIDVTGILHEKGKLYAALASERSNWLVEIRTKDLTSFPRFRRRVADQLSIDIDHESQEEGQFTRRREAWLDAVRRAQQRGAAA